MPDPKDPASPETPEAPLTRTDVEGLISSVLGKTLTGALSRALSPAKLKPIMAEVLAEGRTTTAERPDAERSAEADEEPGDQSDDVSGRPAKSDAASAPGKGRRGKPTDAAEATLADLQGKYTELEGKWKRAEQSAAAERKRAIEQKGLADLRAALTGKVRPDAVALATDVLVGRKQLTFDKDGTARMKIRASLELGAPEEDHEVDLETGVQHFLKSKEGALFVPPPTRGAGPERRPIVREPVGLPLRNGAPAPRGGADKLAELSERSGRSIDDLL